MCPKERTFERERRNATEKIRSNVWVFLRDCGHRTSVLLFIHRKESGIWSEEGGNRVNMERERTKELGEEGLSQDDIVAKTVELLEKIKERELLQRVYRFVQYIYIHRV